MNVSFERRVSLKLLRHVGRPPAPRAKSDRDVQVLAAGGHLYFINSYMVAGCEALVLENGAFWIRRVLLEKVLRSFKDKEIIILEADERRFWIGRFSCPVTLWEPMPEPPKEFEYFPGKLRLSGSTV